MKRERNKIDILNEFGSKARCSYTQYRASQLWKELKPFLTKEESEKLSVGWGHFTSYPWDATYELDHAVVEIREKWKREKK